MFESSRFPEPFFFVHQKRFLVGRSAFDQFNGIIDNNCSNPFVGWCPNVHYAAPT